MAEFIYIASSFDKDKLKSLTKLYKEAVEDNKKSFLFKEKEILTSYAKYLIEYFEQKFKH